MKCTRPSAVSADGLTVAALATHIAAADEHAASSVRRVARGAREDVGVAAGEAERAQRGDVRPLVRRQHRLREAARGERAHLGEPLQRRFARIRDEPRVRSAARLPRASPA